MTTVKIIVDKIVELLSQEYPSCTFYINDVPESVSRPSFNVYLDSDRSEDGSCSLTTETTSIGIVYFAPSAEPVSDELRQLHVYSCIKDMFRKGSIQVEDRTLKVTLLRGGRKDNEIFLIVKLVYCDDRPQDEAVYDLIGDVSIKIEI